MSYKLDIEKQVGYTSFVMLRKIVLASLPLYFWSLSSIAEDGTIAASSTRIETYYADWTVFNSQKAPVSAILTPEEAAGKKREFSFRAAETAQEVADSLRIPFLPQIIEGGSVMAKEAYRIKENVVAKYHLHLKVSRSSARIKFKVRF